MNPSLHNPYEDGSGFDPEEGEGRNRQLNEVLEFYDCYELLPYANHIIWLSSVKEVMGYIPFKIEYDDIRLLIVLHEEMNKKQVKDSQDMQNESRTTMARAKMR
jgi:hypothetical protein